MTVARLEGDAGGAVHDQVDDREDQVGRGRVLHRLARDDRSDADRFEIHAVGARDARPHRREGVEALAERELAKRRLELGPAAGHVVQAGDAADGRAGLVRRGAVDRAPEHDRHLALVVGPGLLARDDDRLVGPDQRRGELGEDDRDGRDLELGLLGVVAVVEADRDQVARDGRVQEAEAGERRLARRRPTRSAPSLRRRGRSPRAARRRRRPRSSPSRRPRRASPSAVA